MTPDEIPQELVDMLDRAAGKRHSRTGPVLVTLAAILTRYDAMSERVPARRHLPIGQAWPQT